MDMVLAWYLHSYWKMQDNDTGTNYSAAIKAEYHND